MSRRRREAERQTEKSRPKSAIGAYIMYGNGRTTVVRNDPAETATFPAREQHGEVRQKPRKRRKS